jgi:carboxyl-terminal processing protease
VNSLPRHGNSVIAIVLALLLSGCATQSPQSSQPSPSPSASFALLPTVDFSSLNRVAAFEKLDARLRADYALATWKSIDFDALHAEVLPLVRQAQADNSASEYVQALRHYAAAFSDGHVRVTETAATSLIAPGPLTSSLIDQQSGGSLGLGLAQRSDSRVIVAAVTPGGPAANAGIIAGTEVTAWNGDPITTAIAQVNLADLAAAMPVATAEYASLERVRLLTRVPVGQQVALTVGTASGSIAAGQTVSLTAKADAGAGLNQVDVAKPLSASQEKTYSPTSRTLAGGVGYVQLGWLVDPTDLSSYPQAIADKFTTLMAQYADAPGLVIDLRGNHGGSDQLAADLCGHFSTSSRFYERTQFLNANNQVWTTLTVNARTGEPIDSLQTTPQKVQYTGPLVVLINPRTVSSGEGLARCIAEASGGTTLGFNGSRGSFAVASGEVPMPDGLVFHYPNGRSVDANGEIQLDSRNGVGGISPAVRVAATQANLLSVGKGEDVELREALSWLAQHPR